MIKESLKVKHIFEEKVSTVVGLIFLFFSLFYLGKMVFFDPKAISWTELGLTLGIGAIGILFMLSKFNWILKFLPGQNVTKKE